MRADDDRFGLPRKRDGWPMLNFVLKYEETFDLRVTKRQIYRTNPSLTVAAGKGKIFLCRKSGEIDSQIRT